jgi:AcrR family transcriptional regulator
MPIEKTKRAPRQLPAKREQDLLDAAQSLFFEKGVSATTTDEIAQKAGISKATLYRRYKDKQAIFEKIILDNSQKLAQELATIELDSLHPRQSLRQAALHIRERMTTPNYVDLMRQIIAEAHTQPELSRQAQKLMVSAVTPKFTAFFEKLIAANCMVHTHPSHAATTFALMAGAGYRPLLNALLDQAEEARRLDADLEMFFKGCQVTEQSKPLRAD